MAQEPSRATPPATAADSMVYRLILGRDPHDADPDHIKEIPVVRTVVGGRTMHLA